MITRTLFALYSVFPAVVAPPSSFTSFSFSGSSQSSIVASSPSASSPDSVGFEELKQRYPAIACIGTDGTSALAHDFVRRITDERGAAAIVYLHEDFTTLWARTGDLMGAIDRLRQEEDVRPDEIGVIVFNEGIDGASRAARDTTVAFVLAIASNRPLSQMQAELGPTRIPTLLVEVVKSSRPLKTVADTLAALSADIENVEQIKPHVMSWRITRNQMALLGDSRAKVGERMIEWMREQVYLIPKGRQQGGGMQITPDPPPPAPPPSK